MRATPPHPQRVFNATTPDPLTINLAEPVLGDRGGGGQLEIDDIEFWTRPRAWVRCAEPAFASRAGNRAAPISGRGCVKERFCNPSATDGLSRD